MASAPVLTPPVSFNTAFERLREIASKDDVRSFNSTKLEDVWTTVKDIERHLESRRSLRGFHRIQPFLAGIEQYSKVVEVLCQGTPYLPYIWAPIKLLLQIAQGHISALEKLIDAYAMIGEAMPRFDRLSTAFRDDPEFQQVMGNFYVDILEFHRRAYMFFRRRSWKLVFDSLWKSFNLRFNGILESLRKHRDLIDQEANAISIVEAKAWRNMQLDEIRQWRAERTHDVEIKERERLASHVREAVAWFGASEDQDDYCTRYSRACSVMDGHWALEEPSIVSWLEQSRENPVMWLNGKPGAGKSVICSKLVEHIQQKTKIVAIFYFFSHNRTFQKQATEVLRSFATQLLAASTDLAPYILESFANNGQRATKKNLGIILEKMITSLAAVRIVVDGLDECPQNEQDEVIEDLLRIRSLVPGACKILLSSRKQRNISRLLQAKPTFRLDDNAENVNGAIASFIQPRLQYLRNEFDPEIIDELGHQVLSKANGMFLWVKLIMFTLEDLHFESDVREAIETLPEDLEAVYERIFLRICGDGKTLNQRTAIRILQWMLVAQRPLKRFELEGGIVLDERVSQITTATRPRGDVLSLCHPILDAEDEPGGTVSFIHFTAQEYLRKLSGMLPFLQSQRSQLTVALSCVLYLHSSLELVDPRLRDDDLRLRIGQGFHDLHLYANDYWLDHLCALVDLPVGWRLDEKDFMALQQAIERLTTMHDELAALNGRKVRNESDTPLSPKDDLWRCLLISPAARSLLDGILAYRKDISMNDGLYASSQLESDKNSDPTLFSTIRMQYQSIVEKIMGSEQVADKNSSDFKARHSTGAFLCRYRNCTRAAQGFNTLELRKIHEESHAPKFLCTEAACGFSGWPFHTRAALKNHATRYHDEEGTASIPDSLGRTPRRSRQDRPLFTLKDSYHTKETPSHKSTSNVRSGVNRDNETLHAFNEPGPMQERLQIQQGYHSATVDSSVSDVGNYLVDLKLEDLSTDLKQEYRDWHVVYNPRLQRRVSLELIYDGDVSSSVDSLCFSPNDQLIAIASGGQISIIDVSTKTLSIPSSLNSNWVKDVQFSPCGEFLALHWYLGNSDDSLALWGISSQAIIMLFTHSLALSDVCAIKYASNGESLVSVSNFGDVNIWNVQTGKLASAFHAGDIGGGVAFSPDGSMLATRPDGGSIRVWNIQNSSVVAHAGPSQMEEARHLGTVYTVAFDQGSRKLVSGSSDRTVKVWDLPASTKSLSMELRLTLEGQKAEVLHIATLPNSSRILSGSKDGGIQLWDYDTGDAILRLKEHEFTRVVRRSSFFSSEEVSFTEGVSLIVTSNSGEFFATTCNNDCSGSGSRSRFRIWKICLYNQPPNHRADIDNGPQLPSSKAAAASRKEWDTVPKGISHPSTQNEKSAQDANQLLMNHGINPGNLSESQLASFQQQNSAVQRLSMEVYDRNRPKIRSIQSMSNITQDPASLDGDPGVMQATRADWNAQQDHTVPNIESSPSMYQEAAFLATDESREESREESMHRARDVHPWGWNSLQSNTAPGAWQTDSADHSQINYDKVRRLWDCCRCGGAELSLDTDLMCYWEGCNHQRCDRCRVEDVREAKIPQE